METAFGPKSSGQILGTIIELLGLRTALGKHRASDSTIKRVLRGEAVKPATLSEVLDAVARSAVDEFGFAIPSEFRGPVIVQLTAMLAGWAAEWDAQNGRIAIDGHLPRSSRDKGVAFLRLLSIDIGIRIGAAACLQWIRLPEPSAPFTWLQPDAVGRVVTFTRERRKDTRTQRAIAEKARVSENTLSAWMSGTAIPSSENLLDLAIALADSSNEATWRPVATELRLVVAGRRLFAELGRLTSERRARDLLDGTRFVAEATWAAIDEAITARPFRVFGEEIADIVLSRTTEGFAADVMKQLECKMPNNGLSLDVAAVRVDWSMRLGWWTNVLAAPAFDKGLIDAEDLLNFFPKPADLDSIVPIMEKAGLQEADTWDAMALQQLSGGRFRDAASLWRKAISKRPTEARFHYNLATALERLGERVALEDALSECLLASQLDATYFDPVREAGVLMIDLERYAEAERQLRKAESMNPDADSVQYHLGLVCDLLGKLEEAVGHYQRTVELNPRYVDALVNCSGALQRLGRKAEARAVAKAAAALGVRETLGLLSKKA